MIRKKLTAVLAAFLLLFVQMGCGEADGVYLEKAGQETEDATEDFDAGEAFMENETENTMEGVSSGERTGDTARFYVYVCGAVEQPGVYVLKEGSRIYEAVALAGGLTEEASLESVNQAEPVSDGQMIRILTKEEVAAGVTASGGSVTDSAGAGQETESAGNGASGDTDTAKVNLNTASAAELMRLPGIGQSKADSIIAYRETKGNFSGIEDVMNVEGIKEGVYDRIKDYIRVK